MIQSLIFITILLLATVISASINKQKLTNRGGKIYEIEITNAYRGVAILMVVIQHCAGSLGTNVFTPFGGTGVAIFLVLSGYGLNESFKKKGLKGFVTNKLFRFWLPFAIFIMVVYFFREQYDWKSIIQGIFSIDYMNWWYVHYILRCYLVFWIAYRFAYKYRWLIFTAFSIYTFLGMGGIQAEQCLSFPLGILLSERKGILDSLTKRKAVMLCTLFLFIGAAFLAIKQLPVLRQDMDSCIFHAVQVGIKLPFGLGIMLLLWLLPTSITKSPLLLLCGTLSYELYLTHMQFTHCVIGAVSASMIILVSLLISYSMSVATKRLKSVALQHTD